MGSIDFGWNWARCDFYSETNYSNTRHEKTAGGAAVGRLVFGEDLVGSGFGRFGGVLRGFGSLRSFRGGEAENEEIDDGEKGGEKDAAENIGEPVHVGEDATDGDEDDGEEHEEVENDAGGAVFEIFWEDEDGEEEDGGG